MVFTYQKQTNKMLVLQTAKLIWYKCATTNHIIWI